MARCLIYPDTTSGCLGIFPDVSMCVVIRGVRVPNANTNGASKRETKGKERGNERKEIEEGWMDYPCD